MKEQFIKERVNEERQLKEVKIQLLDRNLFCGSIDEVLSSIAALKQKHGNDIFIKNISISSPENFSNEQYFLMKIEPETDGAYKDRIFYETAFAEKEFNEKAKEAVNKVLKNKKLTKEEKNIINYINEKSNSK